MEASTDAGEVLCDDRDRRESEDVPEQLYTVTMGIGTEDNLEDDPEAAVLCDEKDKRTRNQTQRGDEDSICLCEFPVHAGTR